MEISTSVPYVLEELLFLCVSLIELVNATCSVNELHLTSVEWVRCVRDFKFYNWILYAVDLDGLLCVRACMSESLQDWIFRQYIVHNARGEASSIADIFASAGLVPPRGTGECAAPKLLEYAYRNGLEPLAMGEFWYGRVSLLEWLSSTHSTEPLSVIPSQDSSAIPSEGNETRHLHVVHRLHPPADQRSPHLHLPRTLLLNLFNLRVSWNIQTTDFQTQFLKLKSKIT